jgi:hypothetical protein
MARTVPPITCVSVIVCDDIFIDGTSHKKAIWGTFDSVFTKVVPAIHPKLSLFVTLTNGRGSRHISVGIERASNSEVIVEVGGPMEFQSPLQIVDVNLSFYRVVFPAFGKYWVTVKEDGRVLAQRPFMVMKVKRPKRRGRQDEHSES